MKQYEVTWIRTYSKAGTVLVTAENYENAHQKVSDQIDELQDDETFSVGGDELHISEVSQTEAATLPYQSIG